MIRENVSSRMLYVNIKTTKGNGYNTYTELRQTEHQDRHSNTNNWSEGILDAVSEDAEIKCI
jgi:hypothetical protein